MPFLIIKIGQNEPGTYQKIKRIRKHGDIVQLLQDDITHPGVRVLMHYFVINMLWGSIGPLEAFDIRSEINKPWMVRESDEKKEPLDYDDFDKYPDVETEERSLYTFDFDAYMSAGFMTQTEYDEIKAAKDLKDGKLEYDLTNLNLNHSVREYGDISSYIYNKFEVQE